MADNIEASKLIDDLYKSRSSKKLVLYLRLRTDSTTSVHRKKVSAITLSPADNLTSPQNTYQERF
jgi:hypothetical protein